jgi:hypothetical protein
LRTRPFALGLSLALAALFAGFLAMSLRTARVAAPVLDRVRIVDLKGYVEEMDLRPAGARMVIGVVSAEGMPREKAPRRVRVTTRKTPDLAAGDFVALKARWSRPPTPRCPAATTSRATPISPASARSARRCARSRAKLRLATRPGVSALTLRLTRRATVLR